MLITGIQIKKFKITGIEIQMEKQFGREKCSGTRKGTASSKHFAKTLKIKRSLAPTRA